MPCASCRRTSLGFRGRLPRPLTAALHFEEFEEGARRHDPHRLVFSDVECESVIPQEKGGCRRIPSGGALFVSKSGAKPDENAIREIVRRWAKAAGVGKGLTPHTFRRSCTMGMIRNRANPAHGKEILGHEDFRSLDAYIRLEIADLKEAHRRFHPRERDEAPPQ